MYWKDGKSLPFYYTLDNFTFSTKNGNHQQRNVYPSQLDNLREYDRFPRAATDAINSASLTSVYVAVLNQGSWMVISPPDQVSAK